MHLPIGRLVPHEAGGDVEFAVVVEVGDRHALAAELGVELRLLKAELARQGRLFGGRRRAGANHHREREKANRGRREHVVKWHKRTPAQELTERR